MLEQQYFVAKYGIAAPNPANPVSQQSGSAATAIAKAPAEASAGAKPCECLKIETFDSSVLRTNSVCTELAWKIDVTNSCAEPFTVRATLTIYDKDEFELDSDHHDIAVPANGVGKARGTMLVSPPDKARRMVRQGAGLSIR
jgi:hypothetical protein